jgi:hypothetical protein
VSACASTGRHNPKTIDISMNVEIISFIEFIINRI